MNNRVKNTLFNLNASVISMLITNLLGFISRTIFLKILDASFLGINGLCSNILSMLSLAELGLGTSIVYSLYKPLAEEDNQKINILMSFYKKAYSIVGSIVAVLGVAALSLLPKVVPDIVVYENYQFYYLLFLLNTVSSYFLSYRETLISADQKGYKLTSRNVAFQVVTTVVQIVILVFTKSYAAYLISQTVVQTVRKIAINRYIGKQYPLVDFKSKTPLPTQDRKTISKNVRAMVMQKIGGYIVFGTDNLLIGHYVSVAMVGIYSNYTLLISIIYTLSVSIFTSMSASVGNLTAGDKKREYEVYKSVFFINFCISSFAAICLFSFLNPFMGIWLGEEFVLPSTIVLVVVINNYLTSMRKSMEIFYNSNGLFWHSRYKSVVEAAINLVVSVILAEKFGMIGIFIGTLVSSVSTTMLWDVYVLYKYGFNKKFKNYITDYILKFIYYCLITIIIYILTSLIGGIIGTDSIIKLLLLCLLDFIVFTLAIFILFWHTSEFKWVLNKVKGLFVKK